MIKITDTYRVKMFYNDGYTEINKTTLFFNGAEYIAEQYAKSNTTDNKYYCIYNDIVVKFLGITIAKRSIRIKEWGQYDEV